MGYNRGMNLQWNRVTWYSKLLAVIVFVGTFAIAFYLGITWEQVQVESVLTPAAQ